MVAGTFCVLVIALIFYVYIFNSRVVHNSSCLIMPFAMLYCLIGYSFVTIGLNVMYAWGVKPIPSELVFLQILSFRR